ncbi:DUF1835 domain-containing protein [Bacillus sp. JJ722]|uniref:DUF1835 domain-containing protein n=1 Tax=Bacillus sp. JJ722 TaxID=3122973 RepID=UPI002FFF298D
MEIEKMKKIIKELPEDEAKSLLFHVYLRLNLVKETDYSETSFLNDVGKIYKTIFDISKERSEIKKDVGFQTCHILFGDTFSGGLKVCLKEMGMDKKEKVISFWDKFSIGSVWMLHEEVGEEERFTWMQRVINDEYDGYQDYMKRFQQTKNQINSIPEGVPITIWVADNSHEQTGLRYVLHLLKNKDNNIKVINTTKKYSELFKKRDIEYTILHTGEVSPEKLQVIYEHSKNELPLAKYEREELENEWLSLSNNQETLRIWKNEKIQSLPEDYYDQFMIQSAKNLHRKSKLKGFMKSSRLIGHVLGNLEQYVGDSFLEYRLRKLIEAGVLEYEGSLKGMRFYSVKLKRC